MATKVYLAGVDVSREYLAEDLSSISIRKVAQDGEVGIGEMPLPDPSGADEAYAGQQLKIADGAVTILDGFVGETARERGSYANAPARLPRHSLLDDNALLRGFRVIGWNRPSETTRARFLAMLQETAGLAALDTSWVLSTHVATMAAKKYTTEDLFEELRQEIADLTGNTAFVENRRAHLHLPTEGITGGLAFSDTSFDYSSAFPVYNPRRRKDPFELGNDIAVRTSSGTSTATDATSITRHDAAGVKHQRLVELDSGDAATRAAKAAQILANQKAERITYEFDTGPLTAAQVDSIPVGCLVNVTSQVLGLSSSTQRIAAITLTPVGMPLRWNAHIELGYPVRLYAPPVRTTNPVDEANAVIRPSDLEDLGSAIVSSSRSSKLIVEGVDQGWGSVTDDTASAGSFHTAAHPWPGTPCGIASLGQWYDRGDLLTRYDYAVGSDTGEAVEAELTFSSVAILKHAYLGLYGTTAGKAGPWLWYGGAGASGAATHVGAMVFGTWSGAAGGAVILPVPLNVVDFLATTTLIVGPGFHVIPSTICNEELDSGAAGDGAMHVLAPTLQLKKLPAGAYGWYWGGIYGTQDGSNRTFTVRGGYTKVRSVTVNGVYQPAGEWIASDGSTITFNRAPLATDLVAVERYIPK